jgi:RNA-binding protein NOB1
MRSLAVDDDRLEDAHTPAILADEAERTDTSILLSDTDSRDDAAAPPGTLLVPNEDEDEIFYDDPSDDDDGEGEWITPSNVALHKSRALDLLPSSSNGKESGPVKQMAAGCMTADFAMQNVLLHLGLNLVGVEGKRIRSVKTWVLRCHACFK